MTVIRYLHLLAMAFFVGGQIFLAAAVVPALRGSDREGLRAVARRFGAGSLIAIGVLVVTGMSMASHYDQWGDTKLHVKLALVALVAGLIVWHIRRPTLHALEGAIFLASLVIVWLGVALAHGV
jgi:uncharacterized membrane protein